MEITAACAAGRAAHASLLSFREQSTKWTGGLKYAEQVAILEDRVKTFKTAVKQCINARDAIHMMGMNQRDAKAGLKKNWHEQKTKIINWLRGGVFGVPKLLCKIYGEIIYCDAVDPTTVGLARVWTIDKFMHTQDGTRDEELDGPKLLALPAKKADEAAPVAPDPLIGALRDHVETNMDSFLNRKKVQTKSLITQERPAILGTMPTRFPFGDGAGPAPLSFFKDTINVPDVVATHRILSQDLRTVSNPLFGHEMIFTVFVGKVIVVVMNADMFLAHPDLIAWFKTAEPKDFYGCAGTVLVSGQALYLPAGTVPLWVGLPADVDLSAERPSLAPRGKPAQAAVKDKAKKPPPDETVTVGISLLYDKVGIAKKPVDLRTRLYVNYMSSKIYPANVSSAKGFDEFVAAIKPPDVPKDEGQAAQ